MKYLSKENMPPKPETPDLGLAAKLGTYEEMRRRLQEERKNEYNQLIAQVTFIGRTI